MNARFSNPAPRGAGFLAVLALVLLFAGAFLLPAAAMAAQDDMPKLGIHPANGDGTYFSETVEPGKSIRLSAQLENLGKHDIKILTYAADAYALVNGGFGVRLADSPVTGTTTWVDFPSQSFVMPSGEGRVIEFTVAVPKDAGPGDYLTSLVIQNADPIKGTGDVTINQILRQAVAIAINIPGDKHPALNIGNVIYRDNSIVDSLQVEVNNPGNVHLKPEGHLRLVDSSGAVLLETEVNMDSVYAGTSTLLEIGLSQPLASGDYKISVDLADAKRGVSASISEAPVAVVSTEEAPRTLTIDKLGVEPIRADADSPVQFANVTASIENPAEPIDSAQVLLHVERDGVLVEDYPLASDTSIESGLFEINQRYLPLTGWQPGTYTFSLRIESVDPVTGKNLILAASDSPVVIEIE